MALPRQAEHSSLIYGGPQRREIFFLWGITIALNKNLPRSKLQKKRIRLHSISSEMLRSQFACKHLPRSRLQKKSSGLHSRSSFLIRDHSISSEMPRSQVQKKRSRLHSNYPSSRLRVLNQKSNKHPIIAGPKLQSSRD